jgi:sirohydrochlorin cobaltochelatase
MATRAHAESGESRAVILVGHGSVSADVPRELVQRLRVLEVERRSTGAPASKEEQELDHRIRSWPRTAATDPYKAGMDAIAAELRKRVGRVVVAFNEYCAPSLEDAVGALAGEGVAHVVIVTTMLTPGGVHSEVEIPETIRALRRLYPGTVLRYAWPFDLRAVAELLADACERPTGPP